MLKKMLTGGAWIFFFRLSGIFANLATLALLTRYLGVEQVADYVFFLSLYFPLQTLLKFGFDQAVLKLTSEATETNHKSRIYKAIRNLFLMMSLSAAGLLLLIGSLVDSDITAWLLVIGWSWVTAFALVVSEYMVSQKRFMSAALHKNAFAQGAVLVSVTVCIMADASLVIEDILLMQMAAWVLCLLSALALAGFSDSSGSDGFRHDISYKTIVLFSIPLLVTQLINIANANMDIWFIKGALPASEVAFYGVASKLVFFIGFFLSISSTVLAPYVHELRHSEDKMALQRISQKIATIAFVPGLLVFLVFQLAPELVLRILYGEGYAQASDILRLLALGHLCSALSGPCGYMLIMFGAGRRLLWVSLICTAISISMFTVCFLLQLPIELFAVCTGLSLLIYQIALWDSCRNICGVKTHVSIGAFRAS